MKLNKKIFKIFSAIDKRFKLGRKKNIFYSVTFFGFLVFVINGLITRGHSFYNFFLADRTNLFMDFFNPLSWLFNGPYTYGASIYPPLPLAIYKLLLRFIPFDIVSQGALVIRASQSGQVVFLFYTLITLLVFVVLLTEVKKGLKLEKYFFSLIILFSAPFLFQFERANIIFVALSFLMFFVFFKDSKNRIIRELSLITLAVAVGIKFYPIIFLLLLLKEKRFRETLKVLFYSLVLLLFPFFVVGGLSQIPFFLRNFFSASNYVLKYGVGYAVSVQNFTRILFGFFGYVGNNAILLGNVFSFILLIFGIVSSFLLQSRWKTVALLSLLMILVPNISFEYTLIFMLIPLVMFLDQKEKEKWDYLYLTCFVLFFIPLTFGNIDFLNHRFMLSTRPLTYGVLIQNIALEIMAISLIWEGLMLKSARKILNTFVLSVSDKLSRIDRFYWLIPVFVILIYNLIFFNKFFPITEGWFSTYAWLFNHGQFPYRDFYFFLTPFYLIKMSIFTTLFGYDILTLRVIGIGVILLMTYFLYKNLEIIFGAAIAAFVSIVGIIYYQSGNAHITYDFIQFVTLYGLVQSYFLLRYIKGNNSKNLISVKWLFWAGLFAGLAFLTKQSNGLIIAVFPFVGLLLLSLRKGKKEIIRVLVSYLLGFAVPVVAIILWLFVNSALPQFIQQVFFGGTASKGGLEHILFSWMRDLLTYNFLIRFTGISLLLLILGYWINFFTVKGKENVNVNRIFLLSSSLFMFAVVLLPLFISISIVNKLSILGQLGGQLSLTNAMVAAISVSIASILITVLLFVFKKPFNKNIFLFSFVSLGFIYGTGTSAGISEAGVFAGFCLFIGLLLYLRSIRNLGKILVVLFCISFTLMWVEAKYENPYYWWNLNSTDIRSQLVTTDKILMLRGLYTFPSNMKLIEEVSTEIEKGSKPNETILTFPNIPEFYLFANRKPPGKALVYWFDFLPDNLAIKEAELIKKNPPKVIVYLDLGEDVWKTHERLFRNGMPSGERKVKTAIMEIIKSKKMYISKKYELSHGVILSLWRN